MSGPPLAQLFRRHICPTSDSPLGLEVESAQGATLRTRDGREFIDMLAGIGVASLGHSHPEVVAAVREQAGRYMHAMVYGEYVLEPQVRLAARLAEICYPGLDVVYWTNSGTEANEGALKTARKFTGRTRLIAFHGSYHGDTMGSLSVTGRDIYRRPFLPLLPETGFLPFGDFEALSGVDETVAAVIVEPVQGEGGVKVPPPGWLAALRSRCSVAGALLIFDEVQTGLGRTGRLWAGEHWRVRPDILVLAKALGGGLPLGAFIGGREVMDTLSHDPPLAHVTTFGGNPVCCAAGLAALEILLRERLTERAEKLGAVIRQRLQQMGERWGGVRDVRGAGMMIGLELETPCRTARFAADCLQRGVVVGWTLHSDTVIRLLPPLLISPDELSRALDAMESALKASAA